MEKKIQFASAGVQPPSALYLEQGQALQLDVTNTNVAGGVVLRWTYRILIPDGRVRETREELAPPAGGVLVSLVSPVQEGFLLSSMVESVGGPMLRGETFVSCYVNLSIDRLAPIHLQNLFRDFITPLWAPGFPAGSPPSPGLTDGVVRLVPVPDPGPGRLWNAWVPVGVRWRVLAVRATYNMLDPTVSLRNPMLNYVVGGVDFARCAVDGYLQAGALVNCLWQRFAYPLTMDMQFMYGQLWDFMLPSGSTVVGDCAGFQLLDEISVITLLVEEFLDV